MNGLCLAIGLSFLASFVLANDVANGAMACVNLYNPEYSQKMCCEDFAEIGEKVDCEKTSNENIIGDCKYPRCLLKAHGFLDDDDNIIDSKIIQMLDTHAEKNSNSIAMVDRIKNKCLNGKYKSFPPKVACPPVKFFTCSFMNAIVECPKWRNEDGCNEMAEQAKKCKKFMDTDILFDI